MSAFTDLAKLATSWLPGGGYIGVGIDAIDATGALDGVGGNTSCPGQQQLADRFAQVIANMPAEQLYQAKSRVIEIFNDNTDRLSSPSAWAFHYLGGSDCRQSSSNGRRFVQLSDQLLAEWETATPAQSWQPNTDPTRPAHQAPTAPSYQGDQMGAPAGEFLGSPLWTWALILALALGALLIFQGRL